MKFEFDQPFGPQGTVAFTLEIPKTFHNGPNAKNVKIPLLSIPGVATTFFAQRESECSLNWLWDAKAVKGVLPEKTLIPALPGPERCHLLYTWNAEKGLFYGYFNALPLRLPGTTVSAWQMAGKTEITALPGEWEIRDITALPVYMPLAKAQATVPSEIRGRHAQLVGQVDAAPLDLHGRLGRTLYASALDSPESIAGWVLEGPGVVAFEDGWMKMSSTRPNGPDGHIVHWAPDDFPARFVADWEMQILSKDGLCIVFFAAMGKGGEDVFDPSLPRRDGVFKQYNRGAIRCYHISYFANNPIQRPGRVTSNLRKNPGAHLVANGPVGIPPESDATHQVRLIRDNERIQLLVDGRVAIDWIDDGKTYGPVLGKGKISLRQMQWTAARYRNFRVRELTANASAK